jgi:hypothetical protein
MVAERHHGIVTGPVLHEQPGRDERASSF